MVQNGSARSQIGRAVTWEWSDLRYLLAVARSGSTSGAARELGVNQTTCARRVEALERALGLALFERTNTGYRMTDAGKSLLCDAEQTERGALAFERLAADGPARYEASCG